MIGTRVIDGRAFVVIDIDSGAELDPLIEHAVHVTRFGRRDEGPLADLLAELRGLPAQDRIARLPGVMARAGHGHRQSDAVAPPSEHLPGARAELVTVAEAAAELSSTSRTIRRQCLEGLIPGATRDRNGTWLIPIDYLTETRRSCS